MSTISKKPNWCDRKPLRWTLTINVKSNRQMCRKRCTLFCVFDSWKVGIVETILIKSAFSNHVNKSRLRILQARQEAVTNVLADARKKMSSLVSDRAKYAKILQALLVQGFFRLMDTDVAVQCKKTDVDAVKAVLEAAKSDFKKQTKMQLNVTISENYLPDTT